MPWHAVTMQNIMSAMDECDHYDLKRFRTRYGSFHAAHNVHMFLNERGPYEARPLLAAADTYRRCHQGQNLNPSQFQDNDAHIFLESFGFNQREI